MIFQFTLSAGIQLLLYLVPLTLAHQMAVYFICQYYKNRDLKLRLHRILLSYGSLLFTLTTGALFIQISRNFINDPFTDIIFAKIGWVISLFSPISFLSFIAIDEFNSIMNIRRMKILMIFSIIPILVIILIPQINIMVIIVSILFLLLNGYYIFLFQIKLIKRLVGQIKKRMKTLFIGEIIALSALIFAVIVGLGIFEQGISIFFYIIGIAILLIGFSTIFIASIDFPPFYEFEWVETLISFYIIDQEKREIIYTYNFKKSKDFGIENQEIFLSKGLIGINKIISIAIGAKNESINEIKQEGLNIILKASINPPNLIHVLLVKKELNSHFYILNDIKQDFEEYYDVILRSYSDLPNNKNLIFKSFDNHMDKIIKDSH